MPVTDRSPAPILVIVRESPLRRQTAELLRSVVAQEPAGLARVVVLRIRRAQDDIETACRADGVEQVMVEEDWLRQASRLIAASGCRWAVLPSSVDRYLPGAFEAVVKTGTAEDEAVVVGCRVRRDGRSFRIGPHPFRFDYFALLSGFGYIAPGATFMSARRLGADGGLDPRFANAVAYEYLLRVGAAHGVSACDAVLVETEAHPVPGIPPEYAALHATEAMSVAMRYNRFPLPPGATLGLLGVMARRLEAGESAGHHDEFLIDLLGGAGGVLTERYLEYVGLEEDPPGQGAHGPGGRRPSGTRGARLSAFFEGPPGPASRVRELVRGARAVTPRPVWNTLRRVKRAWRALRVPL